MIRWKIRGEGTGKARKIDKKIKKKKNILYLSSLRAGLKPASEVRSLFNGRVHSSLKSNKSISEPMHDRVIKKKGTGPG